MDTNMGLLRERLPTIPEKQLAEIAHSLRCAGVFEGETWLTDDQARRFEFTRQALQAADRYSDTRSACEKIGSGDFRAITDEDMRQVEFMTPFEWDQRQKIHKAVTAALAEREHATIH